MLEQNYVSVGGRLETMLNHPKNIGSEAFSTFIFHQASQPDPLDLFGAMFIIEGLGSAKAGRWANRLQSVLGLEDEQVSFLAYHGENDDSHYDKLRDHAQPSLDRHGARPAARPHGEGRRPPLTALQLEEIGNI